ncbi:Hypothetical predicted protein [Cloeon dipterum]|uniref:G-protein coupled receptors family 1 profile domain-containing protein n=1 Tax=Cloeon dipterum TaxID=197152 RepID=A0A8S1DNR4_9INSE|nr:Hypothetical predicted protein [Cloeon dipterum]
MNATQDSDDCACGMPRWLLTSALAYKQVHGPLAVAVCLLGSVANCLNLVVLRELRAAPVNRILSWLAMVDVFVMLLYLPFAYEVYIDPDRHWRSYLPAWAAFLLLHMQLAQVLHTASVLLTLLLATWRCLTLAQLTPGRGSGRRPSDSDTLLTVALVGCLVLAIVLCVPAFLCFTLSQRSSDEFPHTRYIITLSELAQSNDGALYHFHFWFNGCVLKLLPCILLSALSLCLIRALVKAHQHSQKLLSTPENLPMIQIRLSGEENSRGKRISQRTDRTTRMLVAVTLLFLATELPQAVLGVLSGLNGPCFFQTCYQMLGEMLDLLALFNGAVNFVLYCIMSRQFRATFCNLFVPWAVAAEAAPPPGTTAVQAPVPSEVNSTVV